MSHDVSAPVAKRGQQNAVVNARQRLLEVKEAVGTKHADYASALIQLALLLIMHGDPTEAEPLLREALEIRRQTLGEQHPDYATCLSSLAGLLWARGDLDAAEPLLRQALAIRCKALGERHPKSIVSQNSLDQLLQAKKAWDSAADLNGTDEAPDPRAEPAAAAPPADPTSEPVAVRPDPAPAPPEPVAAASEPVPVTPEPPPAPPVAAPAPAVEPETAAGPTRTREELTLAVEELAEGFAGLGSALQGAVGPLREQGILPPDALVAALRESHTRFTQLRDEVLQHAHELGMTDSETRPIESLQDLSALLAELERYELERSRAGKARREALGLLDCVAQLVYVEPKDFTPLRECQEAARTLHQAIEASRPSDLPAEAFALAEGTHPYNALLALADLNTGLNDEEWANALELVQGQWGKPLSVAVARAKIVGAPAA